jgi:hypothetical protein
MTQMVDVDDPEHSCNSAILIVEIVLPSLAHFCTPIPFCYGLT